MLGLRGEHSVRRQTLFVIWTFGWPESSHGQLLYELAHPRTDGSTHLLLDPLELIEKLCVLVPTPRTHVLRYQGGLAPHAAWRSLIVPRSPEDARHEARALVAREPARPLQGIVPPPAEPKRLSWAASRLRLDVSLRQRGFGPPTLRGA